MKVLFLANQDWYFLLHWVDRARALQALGAQVIVAAPPGDQTDDFAKLGLEYRPLPLSRKGMAPLAERRSIRAIEELLEREAPDLLHSLTIKPNLYGARAAARLARRSGRLIPQAASVTGMGFAFGGAGGLRAWLARRAALVLYRRAARSPAIRFLFENPEDRTELVERGVLRREQTAWTPGAGVDLERFDADCAPDSDDCVRFLFAGRLLREKGLAELAEAGRILQARGRAKIELLAAGIPDPGAPGAVSEDELRAWEAAGFLRYLGRKDADEIIELLTRCDGAVLPSYYREGIPRFLIEAAAAGRPGVASDISGVREIVRNEETGLLVPPRNAAALADALQRLAEDAPLRARLGAAGRELAERSFSREAVLAATFAVYRELLPGQASFFGRAGLG